MSGKKYALDSMGDSEPTKSDEVLVEEDFEPERETWNRKFDFLLACVGFSVGLGNVWRFPYLVYLNGGGAFLIPYLICVIVGGIPLFFLEVAVGQFMAQGGPKAWRICPLLQGIGIATAVIVFFLNCYYNIILAWAFYYLFASLTNDLPWDSCDNHWNTERCSLFQSVDDADDATTTTMAPNMTSAASTAAAMLTTASTMMADNTTVDMTTVAKNVTQAPLESIDAATEFWENKVLNISAGLDDMGEIKWDLCLCLVLAWFVVFLCICKGIRTSGKVMYVTATSPYIFMLILLIRMAFLDGAKDGILFYLVPEFERLSDLKVWVDAGTQIFFSYSISLGALTALGSYNKFRHNSYRDSILFACTNSGTSIFAGFLIFEVLGFMAQKQGKTVEDVAKSGPGLAFIAYPTAVSQMPAAPVWSFFFFLMIILLGLDSQFVGVEGLTTACVDTFPSLRRTPRRKVIFVGFLCIIQMLVGLAMVTRGGMYVFQLFDYYSGSKIILLVAFFMCIAILLYGVNRFYDNLAMMLGFYPSPYMKISWILGAPVFCMSVFVMSVINYSELEYERSAGRLYVFPQWAVGIGWGLASLSAVAIPAYAIYKFFLYIVIQRKPLSSLIEPEGLKPHQLRPQDKQDNNFNEKFGHDNPAF